MNSGEPTSGDLHVGSELLVRALAGVPTINPGDDLFEVILASLDRTEIELADGDIVTGTHSRIRPKRHRSPRGERCLFKSCL